MLASTQHHVAPKESACAGIAGQKNGWPPPLDSHPSLHISRPLPCGPLAAGPPTRIAPARFEPTFATLGRQDWLPRPGHSKMVSGRDPFSPSPRLVERRPPCFPRASAILSSPRSPSDFSARCAPPTHPAGRRPRSPGCCGSPGPAHTTSARIRCSPLAGRPPRPSGEVRRRHWVDVGSRASSRVGPAHDRNANPKRRRCHAGRSRLARSNGRGGAVVFQPGGSRSGAKAASN